MDSNEILSQLYRSVFGANPEEIKPITPAGSNRRYFRLSASGGQTSAIGVLGVNVDENKAFISLARDFERASLPAPRVLAVSDDNMAYLQTDLGDVSLFDRLDDKALLLGAMDTLRRFHVEGTPVTDFSVCRPVGRFDSVSAMWDLNYFKYCFLNPSGITYDEARLQSDFESLAGTVEPAAAKAGGLMLRDFQSRNVMVKDGQTYVIDFQGARRGPWAYDVASFLFQARAGFPESLRRELAARYIGHEPGSPEFEDFYADVRRMALLRALQTLGAYGYRGLFERKGHFLRSIPAALSGLTSLLDILPQDSHLRDVLSRLTRITPPVHPESATEPGVLTVRVFSFSYRRGIPPDPSGNGGGFVFDCRGLDNPGRFKELRDFTGLDTPVVDFLEARGEIQPFLESCLALVCQAVDKYISRSFTDLWVGFGCTGGRHRSVYSAQHMAFELHRRYPEIRVILNHREQGIYEELDPQGRKL